VIICPGYASITIVMVNIDYNLFENMPFCLVPRLKIDYHFYLNYLFIFF
jgi:hypothetical protein